jgi:hypothetical protein
MRRLDAFSPKSSLPPAEARGCDAHRYRQQLIRGRRQVTAFLWLSTTASATGRHPIQVQRSRCELGVQTNRSAERGVRTGPGDSGRAEENACGVRAFSFHSPAITSTLADATKTTKTMATISAVMAATLPSSRFIVESREYCAPGPVACQLTLSTACQRAVRGHAQIGSVALCMMLVTGELDSKDRWP